MSWQAVKWALECAPFPEPEPISRAGYPCERSVLVALAHHADDSGRNAWPSVERLMHETGLGESRVRQAISTLAELGLIFEGDARTYLAHVRVGVRPRLWHLAIDRVGLSFELRRDLVAKQRQAVRRAAMTATDLEAEQAWEGVHDVEGVQAMRDRGPRRGGEGSTTWTQTDQLTDQVTEPPLTSAHSTLPDADSVDTTEPVIQSPVFSEGETARTPRGENSPAGVQGKNRVQHVEGVHDVEVTHDAEESSGLREDGTGQRDNPESLAISTGALELAQTAEVDAVFDQVLEALPPLDRRRLAPLRRKCRPQLAAAAAHGWAAAAVVDYVATAWPQPPSRPRAAAGLLRHLLADLAGTQAPAAGDSDLVSAAPLRPAWCGSCDERTRQRDYDSESPARCGDCHPLAVAARGVA